jgi:hypothetical protein
MEETAMRPIAMPPGTVDPAASSRPVLLPLSMPRIGNLMRSALVHRLCIAAGDLVRIGQVLLEVRVDLSDGTAQDCPPISYYRLIARESGTVGGVPAAVGDLVAVGGVIAWLASTLPVSAPAAGARLFRCCVVGIQVDTVFGR